MKVLIIPDKFKGSLSGKEVTEQIVHGLHDFDDLIETHAISGSDGGDGFLESIAQTIKNAKWIDCQTTDPLGREIQASFLFDPQREFAYVEMARASGLELLTTEERNPLRTSSLGTGLLIRRAIDHGARSVFVGLGGSATNDGGAGIASALGYRLLDADGSPLPPGGGHLTHLERIERSPIEPLLRQVRFFAINDVCNPLLGPEGAAQVYAPQKGADPEMVRQLEAGLDCLQRVVRRDLDVEVASVPGAGAAGGAGYGLKAFLNAEFLSGIEFVLSQSEIEALLNGGQIDYIVTGEGRIDDQTAYGKLVRGVAKAGASYGVPVVAICGQLDLKQKSVEDLGLSNVLQIHQPGSSIEYTMENAGALVRQAAAQILKPS
ncbi:glycerate kinase [Roseiconus nitratireducens]|uniref:Glycerate kinase n=1 Tax=Roseiconus nitratireducens TaxID=2605748 RepID=A0A5M6DIY4_9BACT|nr:glycerate kinase [Roseiconus nitratireducens]KAA5546220.1 glycerate kinase [Roseiconus nitratireducens]